MERKIYCIKCGAENLAWKTRCVKCGAELYRGEHKVPGFEKRGAGFWAAVVIGAIAVGIWGWVGTGMGGVLFLALMVVPIASLAVCWKWQKIAGTGLIVSAFLPFIGVRAIPGVNSDPFLAFGYIMIAVIITGPLLTAGIIFLVRR